MSRLHMIADDAVTTQAREGIETNLLPFCIPPTRRETTLVPVPGKKIDAFLLHILPDENRDRVFAFLTALMTATVPIGTGMFSVYINLAKTSYIFCVIGVVIVIFACMYGIIDRNK